MATVSADTTQSPVDAFVLLICADEQLLGDEFDAIIAASWPDADRSRGPDEPPGGEGGCHQQPEPPARPALRVRAFDQADRATGHDTAARERAPPDGQE